MGSSVEQIKERLGIAEVVGSYVKLEKAGSNYKARCPFHHEKTPSFFVSPSRNSYYCFGCGVKGDIFSFVEQFEGLDFVGALKVLAMKAGVVIERENPVVKNEKDRLYKVLEAATNFFSNELSKESEPLAYLQKRGVKPEIIKEWRIGYAPEGWRSLHDELLKKGFSENEMISAGLVKKSDKGFYDMFRGRVMFPIFDSSERVIAFSGRILPRLDDGKTGKYVNSPETQLFNKSRVLYGLHKAKLDIRKRDYTIMVEGQMDLIMSHQAGFTNTVAVSGTALTTDVIADNVVTNLGLVTRLSQNIILSFDSDDAGFKATHRNAKTALSIGMDVKVAKMPKGDDPADIILRNPKEWAEIIKDAKHVIDYSIEMILEKGYDQRKLGREIQLIVLPYVRSLKSAIDQSHFITKIASSTGIKEDALWEEFKKIPIYNEEVESKIPQAPTSSKSSRKKDIERRLIGMLLWQRGKITDTHKLTIDLETEIERILGKEKITKVLSEYDPVKNELIFESELSYDKSANLQKTAIELLLNFEEEIVDEEISGLMSQLYSQKNNQNEETMRQISNMTKKKQEIKAKRQNIDKTTN